MYGTYVVLSKVEICVIASLAGEDFQELIFDKCRVICHVFHIELCMSSALTHGTLPENLHFTLSYYLYLTNWKITY